LFQNAIDACQHLVIPESQDTVATLAQNSRPPLISRSLFGMLATIQLNYQTALRAAEICYELADWELPPKL
jgi:hypothetical protein